MPSTRPPNRYDPQTFRATANLSGARVLLIDDTWTTGATAQSAAAVLREAGATTIGLVALGRHINPSKLEHHPTLEPYDPSRRVYCEPARCDASQTSTSLR